MESITTRNFLELLYKNKNIDEEFVEDLRQKGIIRLEDVCNMDDAIERRSVARITHMFLLVEKHEQDIEDITPANKLRDLYDCRICVNHIAQVYLKGIMEAVLIPGMSENEFWIFDSKANLEYKDALAIIEKIGN